MEIIQPGTDLVLETQLMNTIKAHLNSSTEEEKKEIAKKLNWLNDITTVVYNQKGTETARQLNKLECDACKKLIPNVLIYLCHLNTVHTDRNFTYTADDKILRVSRILQDPRTKDVKAFPEAFVGTHRRKLTAFLKGLLDKITKHEEVVKSRKFYRCDEIFRETNEDETDESEEEIIGDIDEAFRERINSLIDISRSQKEMFFLWNSYIRRIQISYGIRRGLSNRDLLEHLYQFLKEPSLKTLRTQFVNHLSVLFFFGKLNKKDMLELIMKFDQTHPKGR